MNRDPNNFMETMLGHRGRLRGKYLKSGSEAFFDYELLELLLTYAIQRRDVKPIAKALLNKFGNFQAVIDAQIDELAAVRGVGENSAILIKLIRDICVKYLEGKAEKKERLCDSDSLFRYAQMRLTGFKDERILMIYLNSQHNIMSSEILSAGLIDSVTLNPRKVIERVIENNAVFVIMAHNHPSGNLSPSREDVETTTNIAKALSVINVRLLDHLIVSSTGYITLTENPILIRRGVFS